MIEISSLVAGPAMASLLHSLGARVIKIEPPVVGEPSRHVSQWGFLNYNGGKEFVSLNLKDPRGQEILRTLVKSADILVENMGPDIPSKLGFAYGALKEVNPRLIYCSIKGFSPDSKHYERPAFDAVAQAMSGMMSLTGEPMGEPLRIGNPSVDLGAAAYGTVEVLSAVLERSKHGQGKFIQVSLLDMAVYWNAYWLTYYGITGVMPERLGSGHPGYSPHKVFKTRDSKYVFIATLGDQQWKSLSSILNLHLGKQYEKMPYRLDHRDEVEKAIEDITVKMDASVLLAQLSESVPCAPVNTIRDVYDDPEFDRRGLFKKIRYANKTVKIVPLPIVNGSEEEERVMDTSSEGDLPVVGRDTVRVLSSLGYDDKRIDELHQLQVI